MPSKLSFHLSGYPNDVFDVLERIQPSVVKIFNQSSEMNLDEIRRRSNPLVIYRHFSNLDYHNSSADMFFAEMAEPFRKLAGKGVVWEPLNEPVIGSVEDAQALNAWLVRFAEIMHAHGEMVATFCWSTGNPTPAILPQALPYLIPAAAAADLHAFHEYYSRWGQDADWGRYRIFERMLPPYARRPVVITEAGLDDTGDPITGGYRGKITVQEYLQILKAYDALLMQDPYVLGATIYQWGDGSWPSFLLDPIVNLLAEYIVSVGRGQAIPQPWPVPTFDAVPLFTVSPNEITAGQTATLRWEVTDARTVELDGQVVAARGTKLVAPTETTTYTLHLVYPDDRTEDLTAQVLVTAVEPGAPRDELVALAIEPGTREIVLPDAAELRALGPKWIRYLVTAPFQDWETGQNTELDLVLERYGGLCKILVLINPESLDENPPLSNPTGWGDAETGYTSRVANLAQKVAGFYRERIHAIQVFNEPDSQNITPEQYAALLTVVYGKIKAVGNLPVILSGICCGQNHPYLTRVVQNAQGAFDGVGWHPYGLSVDGYPSASWGFGNLRDSLVRAREIAGKPLWLTEIGAELGYSWPGEDTPAAAVAEYVTRAYGLLRELGPDVVAHAFWFTWKNIDAGWGLVDNEGNRRPAWYAFQQQARPAPITISEISLTPATLDTGALLNVRMTVINNSNAPVQTQGPEPGLVYEEGQTFETRGFPAVAGAIRVGIDFSGRTGVEYPYRWGLGTPLAPGETRVVTGAIRLNTPQSQSFWAGLVDEQTGWLQDHQGTRTITVLSGPKITNVAFSPASPTVGQLLNVSITVVNDSDAPLQTQGPDPGFVYEEGQSFRSRGFGETAGKWRVGLDFEKRTGIDHPYRWGLGTPLAPGETRVITGAIRLKTAQTLDYWAGLVHELVAWQQDRQGVQRIVVSPSPAAQPPRIIGVAFEPTTLVPDQLLNISITIKNNSDAPLPTQGPEPGFVYQEGESFRTRGFGETSGAFRVGIDFDGRTGIDHPYRWGLGTPLAPGETRVITGAIRLKTAQARNYWAGLVQEVVAWRQDREGVQTIQVQGASSQGPEIVAVQFAPTTLPVGEVLTVSITVRNNSNEPLITQGPEPETTYEEGDSFYAHGYASIPRAFRVGVDFTDRTGIDHPYRWGFGTPLAPGETRVIAGGIRLRQPQARSYWAGLAQEHIAWLQDHEGAAFVRVTSAGTAPRVVHLHSVDATTWNGQSDYYVYVSQDKVSGMMDRGVMEITGCPSPTEAWRALLPRYQPGQGIAVKVNFTNCGQGKRVDAIIHTLNALVRGLKTIGVQEGDIWVYEAVQIIPDRFVEACQYPGVVFVDNSTNPRRRRATFDSTHPSAYITVNAPAGVVPPPRMKVADVLVNATYVINLPILKGHISGAGVTLGFKNHLGSTNDPQGFHPYIFLDGERLRPDYNPLVDLYANPNIRNKTVLTIGDGLFTGNDWGSLPLVMSTFGNKTPNSLFFSTDPVALDCVMYDLVDAEWHINPDAANYLRLASSAGLGVYERGDPWGSGYRQIDYRKIEM